MEKELNKLNKTANTLGFDLSAFVGIPIAAILLFFVFDNYKNPLLSFLGLDSLTGYQRTVIILILTLIVSVIVYKISGWCLDWIYDGFYSEKKNKNSELNQYINSARQKWSATNLIYETVSIYQPTLEKVEKNDESEYKQIKQKLAVSKIFRIIVLPGLILGIIKVINKDFSFGIICLIIAVVCLFISFNYRAEHSKRLYRWFISS
jgi:hypothetical protein